jgi:hypothetical protein
MLMGSALFGAILICGASSAGAQERSRIVVDVPFAFIVNGKTLPAGRYKVQKTLQDSDCVLYISQEGGREGTSFTTSAAVDMSAPDKTGLIFHHYGSTYYLAEVVIESGNGYRLPLSSAERAAARADKSDESKTGPAKTASQSGR